LAGRGIAPAQPGEPFRCGGGAGKAESGAAWLRRAGDRKIRKTLLRLTQRLRKHPREQLRMLVSELPYIMLPGRIAAVDNGKTHGTQSRDIRIVRLRDWNCRIHSPMKGPYRQVRFGRGLTSVVVADLARQGSRRRERIGPKMIALRQEIGKVVRADTAPRIAGNVNTAGIERIRILSLKSIEQILNFGRAGIVPDSVERQLGRDKKAGIIRLVVWVGGTDQCQRSVSRIIPRGKLRVVIRATFIFAVQVKDRRVFDGRIEIFWKDVPITVTRASDKSGLPHRIN